MSRNALPLIIFLCFNSSAFANIRLPAIIGDHMVLQQSSTVKIWGWCDPAEKIKLMADWDTATYNTTGGSNAKWMIEVKTPPAGGPYKITISGTNTIVIDDVLIGEVWLCSGQSNMEMSVSWGIKQYEPDVAAATNKTIRFFHVPKITAEYPQDNLEGKWVISNPEDMQRFSVVAYFFGQKINAELNVPVGLISSSWGGTPAEVWTPKEAIDADPVLDAASKKLRKDGRWPVQTAYGYNAMIYPLINYNIAGALWYQGESNVGTYASYNHLMTTLITSWRKAWGKELPFYYVQIAPFAGYTSAYLREQQTKTLSVPKTGMVVISDLVDDIKDIHPKLKKDVGLRLANYALAETYGKIKTAYKSPTYKEMKIEKNKIRIFFNQADNGLMVKDGKKLTEFYIAGEDRNFVPATAKIIGNTVVVWNKDVKTPAAVRFGFTNTAMPNLFSKEGLPVNLFRTDDWDVQ